MARPATAARRYAEAVFEIASRDGAHDAWARDLETVAEVAAEERVRDVLGNPAIPMPDRERVLRELVGDRISPGTLNLVRLVVERGRVDLLPLVSGEYRRLMNRHRGVVEAVVTSAAALTSDETAALRQRIESMAGTSIDLRTAVDPSLIGGLTVKVGGRLLDASVRGRLERLRDQLVAGIRPR